MGFVRVMLSAFSLPEDLVAVEVADVFESCVYQRGVAGDA